MLISRRRTCVPGRTALASRRHGCRSPSAGNVCTGRVGRAREGAARSDHERAEQPLLDALRGVLVRVVPERPDLFGAEAVDVAAPGATASCVTPATPSSAFGTSTPCQWIVTPSSMSLFTSVTSTSSPCGRGARARARCRRTSRRSTSWPDARRTFAFSAVSVTRTFGFPFRPLASATLNGLLDRLRPAAVDRRRSP